MPEKIRLLTYHRVGIPRGGNSYEALTVLPRRFRAQLRLLRRMRFSFTTMDTVAAWLAGTASLPRKPVALTFDDGFADIYEHAFPAIAEAEIPAVVYVVTDRNDDSWRTSNGFDPLPLLDWPRIRELADGGITIGSHTRTHVHLTQCTPQQLRDEVCESKKIIEDKLGREVRHFCYPFGDCDERAVDAAREAGYATACTTARGCVLSGANPLRLSRLTVGKRMRLGRFLLRMTLRS